jgi:hypothetical protein
LKKLSVDPGGRVGAHPGNAVARAALHFHDVGDRMLRPAVAWFEFDCRPALRFGAGVVGHFFEARRRACPRIA